MSGLELLKQQYTHTFLLCVWFSYKQSVLPVPKHTPGIAGGFVYLKDGDRANKQRLVCADNNEAHAQTEQKWQRLILLNN